MRIVLFFIITFLLSIAQITLWPGLHLLVLVLIGFVVFVDVIVATVFGLAAGLILDLLGIHYFGLSTTVVFLGVVGVVETVRLYVRSAPDHPILMHAVSVTVIILLLITSLSIPSTLATVRILLLHLGVAYLLVPLLLPLGGEYQRELRERGYL